MKAKKGLLAHRPSNQKLNPPTAKEELEIAKDLVMMDLSLYSPSEIADLIRRQIVSLTEVEDALTPSNA